MPKPKFRIMDANQGGRHRIIHVDAERSHSARLMDRIRELAEQEAALDGPQGDEVAARWLKADERRRKIARYNLGEGQ